MKHRIKLLIFLLMGGALVWGAADTEVEAPNGGWTPRNGDDELALLRKIAHGAQQIRTGLYGEGGTAIQVAAGGDWSAAYPARDSGISVTYSTAADGTAAGTTDQVVHPSVVRIPGGWQGYEYWMMITPYPGGLAAAENPSILCSHDGTHWIEPRANPVYPKPSGYTVQGDNGLFFDAVRSQLVVVYIRDTSGGTREMCMGTSGDGVTWTTPAVLWSTTTASEGHGSPCLLSYRDGDGALSYRLYFNRLAGGAVSLRYREEADYLDFDASSPETTCTVEGTSRVLWDFQAYHFDGQWFLSHAMSTTAGGTAAELHFAASTDGVTWTTRKVMPRNTAGSWPDTFVYTTSVLPVQTESGLGFRAWVSGSNSDLTWGMGETIFRPVRPTSGAVLGPLIFECDAPRHATPASGTVVSMARWAQAGLTTATVGGTAATAGATGVTFGTGGTYSWTTEAWMARPFTAFIDFTTPATLSGGAGTTRLLAILGNTGGDYLYLFLYNHASLGWMVKVGHAPAASASDLVSAMAGVQTSTRYVIGLTYSGAGGRVEFAAKGRPDVRDGESVTGAVTTVALTNSSLVRIWDTSLTGTFRNLSVYAGAVSRADLWSLCDQR